jgi:hypothetical protein
MSRRWRRAVRVLVALACLLTCFATGLTQASAHGSAEQDRGHHTPAACRQQPAPRHHGPARERASHRGRHGSVVKHAARPAQPKVCEAKRAPRRPAHEPPPAPGTAGRDDGTPKPSFPRTAEPGIACPTPTGLPRIATATMNITRTTSAAASGSAAAPSTAPVPPVLPSMSRSAPRELAPTLPSASRPLLPAGASARPLAGIPLNQAPTDDGRLPVAVRTPSARSSASVNTSRSAGFVTPLALPRRKPSFNVSDSVLLVSVLCMLAFGVGGMVSGAGHRTARKH